MSDIAEMLASAKAQGYKEGRKDERPKAFAKGHDSGYQQGRADLEIIRKVFSKMEQPNNCLFNNMSACCYPINDCMNCPITIDEMKS